MTRIIQFCIILLPGLSVGIIWDRMTLVIPVVAACTFLATHYKGDVGKKDSVSSMKKSDELELD